MPDATLDASYQAYNSVEIAGFCRLDKAFTPHPAAVPNCLMRCLTCLIRPTSPLKMLVLCATSGILTMTPNQLFRMPTPHYPLQYFRFQLR
ncbi:Mannitol-1-phosphate 5-dehydrogenase [Escherichia coli]|nr:Mannitol-1-phosphate 5-dehydrogenase [Escherichia coli]